jgi:hypothetical protein
MFLKPNICFTFRKYSDIDYDFMGKRLNMKIENVILGIMISYVDYCGEVLRYETVVRFLIYGKGSWWQRGACGRDGLPSEMDGLVEGGVSYFFV